MNNLDVVKTWFQRVYTDEDLSAIDDMLLPRSQAIGLAETTLMGPEDFKGFVKGFLALLGNVVINIDQSMEDGEWLHVLITITGNCRKTDKPVSFPGQVLLRVVDGNLVEGQNSVDFLSMFSQLGLLPEDAFATCFSGRAIG